MSNKHWFDCPSCECLGAAYVKTDDKTGKKEYGCSICDWNGGEQQDWEDNYFDTSEYNNDNYETSEDFEEDE